MSSHRQSKTPQPTPGHVRNYSQKSVEKAHRREEVKWREREHKAECKAKRQRVEEEHEEAKRQRAEEEWLEAEQKKRAEEEAQRRRRASQERAQARRDEAVQRLTSAVYDVNTAQKVPGASVVVTATRQHPCTHWVASPTAGQCEPGQGKTRACVPCHNKKKTCSWTQEEVVAGPSQKRAGTGSSQGEKKKRTRGKGKERVMETEEADNEWEAGGEDEEEPATPHEGPSRVGVSSWWVEWEWERQLQAVERYAEAHKRAATAFERMAEAVERMVAAAERTANKWGLYHEWAEWVEMRRREDVREARMAELECTGGGWKRPQLEAAEDHQEEVDEGADGDNKEEEEVGGEKEGGEEQEGGGEQVMEE
ncbi:hypothetical protein M404DRAFT_31878 [Pisolithus tinctorius Marx 270]|uniref:Uncharacterized protein n=1 Tax=Pisolithus tinctorius Marx 270 TaxID=870435 RepID=A0A0C3NR01_PISTI|nr:hypothetical protein M404DRAFT_31878 [Pisolithus tinctorius Marx 270]